MSKCISENARHCSGSRTWVGLWGWLPGVDLSAAEDVEVNKNTTKSSSCECFGNHWYLVYWLILMSLRTGSHWAAGAGGVARKALQVIIKDSVYTAVADQTLTSNCRHWRVWRWQRSSPLVTDDWRVKSVVTLTAPPLRSSLPMLRRPPMLSFPLPKLK